MIIQDQQNIAFSHSATDIYSANGKQFHREKYMPKINYMQRYFKQDWHNIKVLDVGIGYGLLLHLLEKEFKLKDLYGMDPHSESIRISKTYTSADIRKGNIENEVWPFEEKFDIINCFDVVEHLKHPGIFFNNAKKYLKSNGIILITTPNKQLPYLMRSIPFIGITDTNPTHINVNKRSYWVNMVKEAGYEIMKEWKGEHLTHIRYLPKIFKIMCTFLRIDHRKIPIINAFEQSFCLVIRLK